MRMPGLPISPKRSELYLFRCWFRHGFRRWYDDLLFFRRHERASFGQLGIWPATHSAAQLRVSGTPEPVEAVPLARGVTRAVAESG